MRYSKSFNSKTPTILTRFVTQLNSCLVSDIHRLDKVWMNDCLYWKQPTMPLCLWIDGQETASHKLVYQNSKKECMLCKCKKSKVNKFQHKCLQKLSKVCILQLILIDF